MCTGLEQFSPDFNNLETASEGPRATIARESGTIEE
jgi:hypothetical protein